MRIRFDTASMPVTSYLPPKAEMCSALANVRFVPIADMHETIRRLPLAPAESDLAGPLISAAAPVRCPVPFLPLLGAIVVEEVSGHSWPKRGRSE